MNQSEAILDELVGKGIGRGGKARPLSISAVGKLTKADVAELAQHQGTRPPKLKSIRNSHHMVAKLLAEGRTNTEIAAITGYGPSRVSVLKHDPTFKELISYYGDMTREVYVNVHERLAALSIDALETIQERLEQNPEHFELSDLQEVVKLGLDRVGYGPKSTVNHTGSVAVLTDEALQRIKAEAERRRTGVVRALSGPGESVDSVPISAAGEISIEEIPETEGDKSGGAGLRKEVLSNAGEGAE